MLPAEAGSTSPAIDAQSRPSDFVRDEPVPRARCPHCAGGADSSRRSGAAGRSDVPDESADRLTSSSAALEREELHVLVLDSQNVVIEQERVYQGNVSAAVARIGELFRTAVTRHASGIIIWSTTTRAGTSNRRPMICG